MEKSAKSKKTVLIIASAVLLVIAVGAGVLWAINSNGVKPRKDMVRGELNIMSYNVLCSIYNYAPHPSERSDGGIAQIEAYKPDVAGLQEVCTATYSEWEKQLSKRNSPYKFVEANKKVMQAEGEDYSFCGILYNSNTVDLLASGTKAYENGNDNKYCRIISWGKFQDKSTKKTFLLLSTHWALNESDRELNAIEIAGFIEKLKEEQGTDTVFATGDFNARLESSPYSMYLNKTGFADASVSAEVKGLLTRTTSKWTNSPPWSKPVEEYVEHETDEAEFAKAIDHISYSNNGLTAKYFTVICNKEAWYSSDHRPVFASFDLSE